MFTFSRRINNESEGKSVSPWDIRFKVFLFLQQSTAQEQENRQSGIIAKM